MTTDFPTAVASTGWGNSAGPMAAKRNGLA